MSDMHDLLGIGLGPFNLGLAALAQPIEELDCVFLESRSEVSWHPGLLLDDATLQVPFLADLVSLADPTSPWSFLNFLKQTGRLYRFYVRERFQPHRREYDQYCRWVAGRLPSVRLGRHVERVEHDGEAYRVHVRGGTTYRAHRLVLGVGTTPWVPDCARALLDATDHGPVLHSADYLHRREELLARRSITVVGSGQSAAEVYLDLLTRQPDHDYALTWLTRSPRFFSMEYSKLTLELTSPEYSAYFQQLPPQRRAQVLAAQQPLYKGISTETVDAIHELLYTRSIDSSPATTLLSHLELRGIGSTPSGAEHRLRLHHVEQGHDLTLDTEALVLATGYRASTPSFLEPVRDRLRLDHRGRLLAGPTYAVDRGQREIWVQNAEEHTHGFVAPDLGMGAHRNSVILADVLGYPPYPIERRVAFQEFGVPERLRDVVTSGAAR